MESMPTLQEQITFHDQWNETHRLQSFEEIEEESRARGQRVLGILDGLGMTRPSILEVGCGTGWLTAELARRGPTMATDLSPRAIEIAKERGIEARFFAADFYTHDFRGELFDIVVCVETLAQVPEQAEFVAKLSSLIRPGGYLILTVQNKFVYERRGDIGPPPVGNVRKWLTGRQLDALLSPHLRTVHKTTVMPKGHKGILRLVNSCKLNGLLERVFPRSAIDWPKEKLGLGQTWVVLAQSQVL